MLCRRRLPYLGTLAQALRSCQRLTCIRLTSSLASSLNPDPGNEFVEHKPEAEAKPRSYLEISNIVNGIQTRKTAYLKSLNTIQPNNVQATRQQDGLLTGVPALNSDYVSSVKVGDLVVMARGRLAVVLEVPDNINIFEYTIVNYLGIVSHFSGIRSIEFKVPGFFSRELLKNCIREVRLDGEIQQTVSFKLRKILCPAIKKFSNDSRALSNRVTTIAKDIFKHLQKPKDPVNMSFFEFAWQIQKHLESKQWESNSKSKPDYSFLEDIFPPELSSDANANAGYMAVKKILLYTTFLTVKVSFNTKILIHSQDVSFPRSLTVIPRDLQLDGEKAVNMLRGTSAPYYQGLVDVLESLLEKASKGISIKGSNVNHSQQKVIDILTRFSLGDINSSDASALSNVSSLLRRLRHFNDSKVEISETFKVLQSAGLFNNWDNPIRGQEQLKPFEISAKDLLTDNSLEALNIDLEFDRLKSIREDFGQLPVYCIDDAGAHEIDDGISLLKHGANRWTIYVHIADPVSYFPSITHPQIRKAHRACTTVYYPEGIIPMFPPIFTSKIGLTQDVNNPQPKRTMTFSIDFNPITNSLLFETFKISPGQVHNINSITYDQVDSILESKSSDRFQDLFSLKQVADAFQKYRQKGGAIDIYLSKPKIRIDTDNADISNALSVSIDKFTPSRQLVSNMMVLCNLGTAQFTRKGDIPSLYRRNEFYFPSAAAKSNFKAAVQRTTGQRTDMTSQAILDSMTLMSMIEPVYTSSSPGSHSALGISEYSQVTSPLRRFQDVVCHWQIGTSLLNNSHEMLDNSQIEILAKRIDNKQSIIKKALSRINTFYVLKKIQQLVNNGSLDSIRCIVISDKISDYRQRVYCQDWGIHAMIELDFAGQPFKTGYQQDCKIREIDPYSLDIILSKCT